MIPFDFNSEKKVMAAWRAYQASIRYRPSDENMESHKREVEAKQTHLIFEMISFLGYDLAESEIQDTAYAAQGLVDREILFVNSLQSGPRIAAALENNNQLLNAVMSANQGVNK